MTQHPPPQPTPPTTTPPPIYIRLRETIDWSNESTVNAQLIPAFRPKLQAWNNTFNIPYHLFRTRLKQITLSNLSQINTAKLIDTDPPTSSATIIPIDDDDWLSPHIAQHLNQHHSPNAQGYYWTRYVLEARPQRNPLQWLLPNRNRPISQPQHDRWTCGTNNYAIHTTNNWLELFNHHRAASRYFDTHPDNIQYIPQILSVQNRNLSSQTVLGHRGPMIGPIKLRRRYHRYKRLYNNLILPPNLNWMQPCINQMAQLMNELKFRK